MNEDRYDKRLKYLHEKLIPSLLEGSDYKYIKLDLENGALYNLKKKCLEFQVGLSPVGIFSSYMRLTSEFFDWEEFRESDLHKRTSKLFTTQDFEKYREKKRK